MDPDTTLAEIRELILTILDKYGLEIAGAETLAEKVAALDAWLSGGGFLPADWSTSNYASR